MENKSVVFLWAEITGYVCELLDSIHKKYNLIIDVVYWDSSKINSSQHRITNSNIARFHGRSVTSQQRILELLILSQPSVVIISGWMDKGYIWACRRYKRSYPSVKIVAGIDDQWTGSLRQRIGQFYYRYFFRKLFDYMWVAGNAQFAFANRFGYDQSHIINNIYSGIYSCELTQAPINRRFIYVGRCMYSKGVDLLVLAHKNLPNNIRQDWPLLIIGNGELDDYIKANADNTINQIEWLQPSDLSHELRNGGIGCMPSRKEQWGVAIHEYTQHGLPLLLSNVCGAANEFLINGYNGYSFLSDDVLDLRDKLLKISKLTDVELKQLCEGSLSLSKKLNPDISAASLFSVLET